MVDITGKAGDLIGSNASYKDVEALEREFLGGVAKALELILFFTLTGFFLELLHAYIEAMEL